MGHPEAAGAEALGVGGTDGAGEENDDFIGLCMGDPELAYVGDVAVAAYAAAGGALLACERRCRSAAWPARCCWSCCWSCCCC